ncbi:MAG: helix-turn-helix domain-containing protein [Bifidobacterium tibiigranuli]|jgi:hypothetical protein|nr:helix-turn-helix domain-containing protein [Bifidobacterium tibiigranuli]
MTSTILAPQQELWSPKRTAEYLGLSTGTLANWRYQGKYLRYVKVGAAIRYEPNVVMRFKREGIRHGTGEES